MSYSKRNNCGKGEGMSIKKITTIMLSMLILTTPVQLMAYDQANGKTIGILKQQKSIIIYSSSWRWL